MGTITVDSGCSYIESDPSKRRFRLSDYTWSESRLIDHSMVVEVDKICKDDALFYTIQLASNSGSPEGPSTSNTHQNPEFEYLQHYLLASLFV